MSVTVEDGTTVAGADAYQTAAQWKTWANARGLDYTAYDDTTLIEQAIRRATAWLDGAYQSRFPGLKVDGRDQAREWPRTGACDAQGYTIASTVVPAEIITAANEATFRELTSPGTLNPDIEPGGGLVSRERIGPIETEYAVNGQTTKTFPAINAALAPLIGSTSMYSGRTARA